MKTPTMNCTIKPPADSKEQGRALPRIAASSYLNTAPLIWSFTHGQQHEDVQLITDAAPARCADMLERGEVEAALVPVIEYQRLEGVRVVPNVCVGARERVQSVVLLTRGVELKDVHTVALDTSSRTSAALIQIIFREFLGHCPDFVPYEPNINEMLGKFTAALIIGDPALTFPRAGLKVYDLAGLWRMHTGLGFVFAMWMVREGAQAEMGKIDFGRARDEGLQHVEEIIAAYKSVIGWSQTDLRTYLQESICYELNEEMQAGLELFYRLAHKHRLIESVRPLKVVNAPAIA